VSAVRTADHQGVPDFFRDAGGTVMVGRTRPGTVERRSCGAGGVVVAKKSKKGKKNKKKK
jgi:hypothetical protein